MGNKEKQKEIIDYMRGAFDNYKAHGGSVEWSDFQTIFMDGVEFGVQFTKSNICKF